MAHGPTPGGPTDSSRSPGRFSHGGTDVTRASRTRVARDLAPCRQRRRPCASIVRYSTATFLARDVINQSVKSRDSSAAAGSTPRRLIAGEPDFRGFACRASRETCSYRRAGDPRGERVRNSGRWSRRALHGDRGRRDLGPRAFCPCRAIDCQASLIRILSSPLGGPRLRLHHRPQPARPSAPPRLRSLGVAAVYRVSRNYRGHELGKDKSEDSFNPYLDYSA